MNVFKAYFKILKRNIPSLSIHFIIFVIMLGGLMLGMPGDDYEINENIKVSVINRDTNNEKANKLERFIKERYTTYDIKDTEEDILNALTDVLSDYILVINEGFKLEYYGSAQSTSAVLMNMNINEYLNNQDIAEKYLKNPSDTFDEMMAESPKTSYVTNASKDNLSVAMRLAYNFSSYPLMALLMNAIFIGLKNFNKEDIDNRIGVSGVNRKKYTMQLYIASLASVLLVWAIINTVSIVLFRNADKSDLMMYVLNSLVFVLPISALGFLISNNLKRDAAISGAITVISLGLSFISGVFVTSEFLSSGLVKASTFFPTYWFVRANTIVANNGNMSEIWMSYLVMIAITLGIFGLNAILKKRKTITI